MKDLNINCVISARGGSKGVPSKNTRQICGKPMIAWTIEHALGCPLIKNVIVSTDCKKIAKVALDFGADVPFVRPAKLASDSAGKWEVWQHALNEIDNIYGKTDIYIDLDCTSPLRDIEDITNAIQQFMASDYDAVFSICEARKNPYFNMVEEINGSLKISKSLNDTIIRRQDAPKVFEHVASIYVLRPSYIINGSGLLSGNTTGYLIDVEKSYDVDSEEDFAYVQYLLNKKNEI